MSSIVPQKTRAVVLPLHRYLRIQNIFWPILFLLLHTSFEFVLKYLIILIVWHLCLWEHGMHILICLTPPYDYPSWLLLPQLYYHSIIIVKQIRKPLQIIVYTIFAVDSRNRRYVWCSTSSSGDNNIVHSIVSFCVRHHHRHRVQRL